MTTTSTRVEVVSTFNDQDEKEREGGRFSYIPPRRRSSVSLTESIASSIASSIHPLKDMLDLSTRAQRSRSSTQDESDPEEASEGSSPLHRYDPSRLSLQDAEVNLDSDSLTDNSASSPICVTVPKSDISKKMKREDHPLDRFSFPSPSSFCKQRVGISPFPILIILSAGLIMFVFMMTRSDSSSTSGALVFDKAIGNTEDEKLRLSGRIIFHCSRRQLDLNMSDCQHLCRNHMCCFEEEEQYNCVNAKGEECFVHAGCGALFSGH